MCVCVCSRRNDHLLSPVPENMTGRPMNSSASDVGVVLSSSARGWSHGHMMGGPLGNGPLHRSMELVTNIIIIMCTCVYMYVLIG